ncbi:MAG: hypothetical protein ABEH77_01565 [Halobacteriaceae archaeon]
MSRWWDRGQTEPLAALAAVAALGIALGLYAGALDTTWTTTGRTVEEAALRRTVATLRTGAVVAPGRVGRATAAAADGYRMRVTIEVADRRWSAGPDPPDGAAAAARTLPVRVAPGTAVPGRVRVEVWPWPAG